MGSLTSPFKVFRSILDLDYPSSVGDHTAQLMSFIPNRESGGGTLLWKPDMPQSQHNGITVLSPAAKWDGTLAGLPAYRNPANAGTGTGCWVRPRKGGDIMASWAGFDTDGEWIADEPITTAAHLASTLKRCLRIDSGSIIKSGFTTGVQMKDKFNIFSYSSFVLRGITGLSIIADNDVEVNTDHPLHRERTVFFLEQCHNVTLSGFNWNSTFTDYSFEPNSPYEHHIREHWMGVVMEACGTIDILNHRMNAGQFGVKADCFSRSSSPTPDANWNQKVSMKRCYFQYMTNYAFLSRRLDNYIVDDCDFYYNGRKWHTYGEALAPTTYTTNQVITNNRFYDQIAGQSCITPGSYAKQVLIANNFCRRYNGIFIEIGSASNINILNNVSLSTGERIISGDPKYAGTTHILMVSGGVDDEPAGGLSNLNIQGNNFQGGGYALQEYNTGTPIRRGITYSNNHLVDCIPPACTNANFEGMVFENNYIQAPDDFPDMAIGGKYSTIRNNILIGVRIRARGLGYRVVGLKVIGNLFRPNSVNSVFPALIDYSDLEDLSAYDNDVASAKFTDVIVNPANCNVISFIKVGQAEGFIVPPSDRFGAKIQNQKSGASVLNRDPTSVYAYVYSGSESSWKQVRFAA